MSEGGTPHYDLVLVGTGFASSFFLARYLKRAPASSRVLVLERGAKVAHETYLERRREVLERWHGTLDNRTADKPWIFDLAFGGTSNLWFGCTPRFLPADFELHSRYGRGRDWPLGYGDLERFYCDAEDMLAVAGPSDHTPFERSRPYPQTPHEMSKPGRTLQAAWPDQVFAHPCARPTSDVDGGATSCCACGVCVVCPVDSKFTVQNGLSGPWADPRVTLRLEAPVQRVETRAGLAHGVVFSTGDRDERATGDLIALGTNAIFNPFLLLKSGITGGPVGERLFEQMGVWVDVLLDGLDGFQGTTAITGHGYMLYDGPHRKERAAALLELYSSPNIRSGHRLQLLPRLERGRWRQRLIMKMIVEDLPRPGSRVSFDPKTPDRPVVAFAGRSDYAMATAQRADELAQKVLAPLPVERVSTSPEPTEAHILGTTAMGDDPKTSVVDRDLRHHRLRNLLVLGGSVFPVGGPANPTLTICALSLRAADRLWE